MELNTPNRNQITSTAPLSQIEDSPVFNYINNLSPIELVKSMHTGQTFNLPSFASPLSVFTSPQLSSQCATRSLIRRGRFSEPSKPELLQGDDVNSTSERVLEAVKLNDLSAEQSECCTPGSSAKEFITKPSSEQLELAIELPKALEYDCASTDGNMVMVPLSEITEPEILGKSNERYRSYESEKDLRKFGQNEDEDWVALISNVADILTFDEEPAEEQKLVDPGTISFISSVLQIPQDNSNDSENTESSNRVGSSKLSEKVEPRIRPIEFGEQKEADQTTSVVPGTPLENPAENDAAAKVDVKGKSCQPTCKQHKIRRRCLVFEMVAAQKKKLALESNNSSTSSPSDHNGGSVEKHATPGKTDRGKKLTGLSGKGIGLHLNALATRSNGKVVKIGTLASGKQEISNPPWSSSQSTSYQVEADVVPCGTQAEVMEDALQTSMVDAEDFGISSPKMKRQKLEYLGTSCKRCSCKRSKCLKLYCECFAAGLYCIEPCSCHDCFNNPAHEDTVLETRRQIESRNPLAFAPKVIRGTDSVSEFGDESNKTPASARHKRGCNCRKSSCLKKYCECFQGGVGCSSYCRCEGCRNTFGCKNGFEEIDLKGEESEAHEKNASDMNLLNNSIKAGEEESSDLITAAEKARSPIHQQITVSGQLSESSLLAVGPSTQLRTIKNFRTKFSYHQTKFEKQLQVIPEDETPEILKSNCSPASGVVSVSPNCKRVSPPHYGFGLSATWRRGRKLILRSVPPSPSVSSPSE